MVAVIDIGSNSVRLMTTENGAVKKYVSTTKLGEGLAKTGRLSKEAIDRTAKAVKEFVEKAKNLGYEGVSAFATEAVRSAENGGDFVNGVFLTCGVKVRVLTGDEEASCGFDGASRGKQKATVIDIGGASTEVVSGEDGKVIFDHSFPIGIVRALDLFGTDRAGLRNYVKDLVKATLSGAPVFELVGIGGSILSLAGIDIGEDYDPRKTDGHELSFEKITELGDRLFAMSVEDRRHLKGLNPKRAETIVCGTDILIAVLEVLGAKKIVASESDNMEGFERLFLK